MRVVITGGGSGGHITPLRPIAVALKEAEPSSEIIYIGVTGDRFRSILDDVTQIHARKSVLSGKIRRYPNESLMQRFFDIRTHVLNIRDIVYIAIGSVQALLLLSRLQPAVIFSKSGPASIPLGIAARMLSIPLVTHDSDAIPSWTHRLIGRWANKNLVANKAGLRAYPSSRSAVVGIPLHNIYTNKITISKADEKSILARYDLSSRSRYLIVVGGSLGASVINEAVVARRGALYDLDLEIVHVTGTAQYGAVTSQIDHSENKYHVIEFIAEPIEYYMLLKHATVVLARAGASTVAEIAALGKKAVIVPAAQLADQQENARILHQHSAGVVVSDESLADELVSAVEQALADESRAQALHKLAVLNSADLIATEVLHAAKS